MTGMRFSFVGYQPLTSVHTRAAQVFGRALKGGLGGDVDFVLENNVADSGLKAADCLSLVERGERTFCYFASSYSAHRFAEIAILDLPFLISDRVGAYRALDGDFGDAMKEIVPRCANNRLSRTFRARRLNCDARLLCRHRRADPWSADLPPYLLVTWLATPV